MALGKTIYWHDYETFGSNPRRDRPCQFAGIRTDEDLNIIGEPLVIYCQPATDFLPDPEACLITGITPQEALQKGLSEAEFCAQIAQEFSQPETCVAGYNSIRFDDEVTRHLLYRCFYDPYEREWKNGNSRWDIIDLLRMTHALRPAGIHWPNKADGTPSFRLEELTQANGIGHEAAHDALADVIATIEVAKLVKQKQPRLYHYLFQHRQKGTIAPMLNLNTPTPLLHVSAMYAAKQGCMAVVLPLAQHPQNPNGRIVVDLAENPESWIDLSVVEIQQRLFTKTEDLAEGVQRVPLKVIHVNKCPALAPLSVLSPEVKEHYGIDLERCQQHQEQILGSAGLVKKIAAVFSESEQEANNDQDPDLMLYSGGFFGSADKASMAQIRSKNPEKLSHFNPDFHDQRLAEMLFRYRGRNYSEFFNADETRRWYEYCRHKLQNEVEAWQDKLKAMQDTFDAETQGREVAILKELTAYGEELCQRIGLGP